MLKFVHCDAEGKKRKQTTRACQRCRERKKRCTHGHQRTSSEPLTNNANADGDNDTAESHSAATTTNLPYESPPNSKDAPPIHHGFSPEWSLNTPSDSHHQPVLDSHDRNSPVPPTPTSPQKFRIGPQGGGGTSPQGTVNHHYAPSTSPRHGGNGRPVLTQDTIDSTQRVEPTSHPQPSNLGSRFVGDLNPEGTFLADTSPKTSSATASVGMWLASKIDAINPSTQSIPPSLFNIQGVLIPLIVEECRSILPPLHHLNALITIYFDKVHPMFPAINEERFTSAGSTNEGILLKQAVCLIASMNFQSAEHLRLPPHTDKLLSHREFAKCIFTAMKLLIDVGAVTDKIVLIQVLGLMSFSMEGSEGRDLSSHLCMRAIDYVFTTGVHVKSFEKGSEDDYKIRLLCCLWVLDKFHSAFHGRPVVMHERDSRADLDQCFERQDAPFRVLLRVAKMLDKVIEYYRPRPNTPGDGPSWEKDFPSFEEILADCSGHRIRTPILATIETLYHAVAILSHRPQSEDTTNYSSTSCIRQALSAKTVTHMVGEEHRSSLTLLPWVSYAVSLSLSVAYRELRRSKVPMYRTRARRNLQANCDVLDWLGNIFWTASVMSDMAKATLAEFDKALTTMADHQHHHHQQNSHHKHNGINGNLAVPNTDTMMGSTDEAMHNGHALHPDESRAHPNTLAVPTQAFFDGRQRGFSVNLTSQELDALLQNSELDNVDPFGYFSPTFDLNTIDTCLEGNLNLSYPLSMQNL